jgi:acetyltransferase-like isoleucine patch superfamily enzyme
MASSRDIARTAEEKARDLPKPVWEHETKRIFSGVYGLIAALKEKFLQLIVFRSLEDYLRYLGVRIGTNCSILNGVGHYGSEPWLIEIGNRVTITDGVTFITHDGSSRLFRQLLPDSSSFGNRFGTIRIYDNCFIGRNTILMPDIKIGPNSIVGAGSLVNKDVPPNTVFAGVPARQICTLEEYIQKYQQKMIPIEASTRQELREELTRKLWGEVR